MQECLHLTKADQALVQFDLRLLRCYVVVAEELHFGRAAMRLGVGQPSLSRTIRTFERQLGTQLLVRRRNPKKTELTRAGYLVLLEGRELLARYQALAEKAQHANTQIRDDPESQDA